MSSPLRADLYNTPAIPSSVLLPNGSVGLWQPTVVTLITGQSEAVLVDTLFTTDQGIALGDWIDETLGEGRRLTTIYITHGHGDHWFNLRYLVDRYPGIHIFATKHTIRVMEQQLAPEYKQIWHDLFPGQIPDESFRILAQPLENDKFTVEEHLFEAIEVGHSDTDSTTFLHVPDLALVVAGDVVYNDVHMWMRETTRQEQSDEWVSALDEVQKLDVALVVASHHRPGGLDGMFNVIASKEYVRTYRKLVGESSDAVELYDKVRAAFPHRLGLLVLWLGCQTQFPESSSS